MKKTIIIQTRFEARHSWPDCPYDSVAFLRYPHRHEFWVIVELLVSHNNRDVEFIIAKRALNLFIAEKYKGLNLGTKSCEDIAEEILTAFETYYSVTVMEDGENGAKISKE